MASQATRYPVGWSLSKWTHDWWTKYKNVSRRTACCHVLYIVCLSSFVQPPTFSFFLSKPKKQTWKEGKQTKDESSWGRMWRQDEVKKDTGGKLVKGIFTPLLSWAKGRRSWTNKHAASSETGRQSQMAGADRLQSGKKMKNQQRAGCCLTQTECGGWDSWRRKWSFWAKSNHSWERTGYDQE